MSRYRYNSGGVILDLKRDMSYHAGDIVDLLEGKDIHITELQKQLEEKDKELLIERTTNDNWYKREVHIRDEKIKMLINRQNQKAISELEKLKDFFLESYKDEEMDTDFLITKDAGNIAGYVLDRIKELKGER